VRDRLIERANDQSNLSDLNEENEIRREIAERLFPLPIDRGKVDSETDFDLSDDDYNDAFEESE
jgi:type IV secretion system protein VirD4